MTPPLPAPAPAAPGYAELHCLSNFSFQRGASSARELFERARDLGYRALAITDECSLAGIVRALEASGETGVRLITGSEVTLACGTRLVLLVRDQTGYANLCRLITHGRRRSPKGRYHLERRDLEKANEGLLVLWPPVLPPQPAANPHRVPPPATLPEDTAAWLAGTFPGRAWIAVELHRGAGDAVRLAHLQDLGHRHGLPLVASGDVHMHVRERRALQDVMTAIRLGCTVAEAGHALFPNGERHLRSRDGLAALYPAGLLAETLRIAGLCRFDLRQLGYRYPRELVPDGRTALEHLRRLTHAGAARRWPQGMPETVRAQVERELALIGELGYEHFFLTVEEIVAWARAQDPPILCQGRGSSANSAVCFCLGITSVNPESGNLLFERFISRERGEPPDIDVDFEHERREEVIQHVFERYGRERAALAATVITYRSRSAVRDVGRALGLPTDSLDALAGLFGRIGNETPLEERIRSLGLDPHSPVLRQLFALAGELRGFPRHLSQHVGGFVISEDPLHQLVPVENAAMPGRTIIQWDKDDLETMRLLKVDCLALGMLTALRKCLDLLHAHRLWRHRPVHPYPDLADIPVDDDPDVYAMISRADTVGVFQIESRAQMAMLPRMQPRTFYDLVVEIALVRPGPIQGEMVHPYLRRRQGLEKVDYPRSRAERESGREPAVKAVLERTLGVPIFQEQVMRLLEVVAGFTPGEADELRRAMAAWRRRGTLDRFEGRIREGMLARGYDEAYFERVFQQIRGFGEYGFPESHSASFAQLAWCSSWLKHYHPAAFTCALLNAQPMGFYAPAQLVQDARRNGVEVRPVDVNQSDWDCTLEPTGDPAAPALRLGLRQVRGLAEATARALVKARGPHPFASVQDLVRRARLDAAPRARLADAGALAALSGHRYRARWESAGAAAAPPLLDNAATHEDAVRLRQPSLREEVLTDYATLGLSLKAHPLRLVRGELERLRYRPAREVADPGRDGRPFRCAGVVTVRQHPATANGVTFVTIEDESGQANVIVWHAIAEAQARVLMESRILGVEGVLQASDGVHHLVARRLHDLSGLLPELGHTSRDFR